MPKFAVGDLVYVGGRGFPYQVKEFIAHQCEVRGEVNSYRVGSLLDRAFAALERPGSRVFIWYEEGLLSVLAGAQEAKGNPFPRVRNTAAPVRSPR